MKHMQVNAIPIVVDIVVESAAEVCVLLFVAYLANYCRCRKYRRCTEELTMSIWRILKRSILFIIECISRATLIKGGA